MLSIRSKLETLAWFAARPAMYRDLVRRLFSATFRTERSLARDRAAAEEGKRWCREVAVSIDRVLSEMNLPPVIETLAERDPSLWMRAEAAFRACGGTMGGPAHLGLLYHVVRHRKPAHVLETGVAAGWSSLAILAAMQEAGHGRLTSIDMPYPKRGNEALVGCIVPDEFRARWTLIRKPDRDALPAALRGQRLGLSHYDSDKSYEGRMFAYPRLWDALESGGIFMSDDVEDNLAFRAFAERTGATSWVVDKGAGNFAGLLIHP